MRHLRASGLTAGAITLLVLVGGCGAAEPDAAPDGSSAAHGTEFAPATHPHIAIRHGEKFSIVVDENASAGDQWQLKVAPDPAIAKTEKQDFVATGPTGASGGGGKRYFVFTATQPGESELEIYNCFRGCQSASDKEHSAGYAVHIQVI